MDRVLGEATVSCPNDDGEFTLRLRERDDILKDGTSVTMLHADRLAQTCACEFEEDSDERDRLIDRAATVLR